MHTRLKQYDYSQPGAYFITFCTKNRELLLSGITQPDPSAPAVTRLTEIGRIVEGKLRELPIGISLDKWVIMPNHVHLLVTIEQTSEAKIELSQFVRMVKSKSSHAAEDHFGSHHFMSMLCVERRIIWKYGTILTRILPNG